MTITYAKWSLKFQNILTISIPRPTKIYPNWYFWYENIPSGNPAYELWIRLHVHVCICFVSICIRVTRLGEFSPIGRLFTLGSFCEDGINSTNNWVTFYHV
jgi:hypothetical protein